MRTHKRSLDDLRLLLVVEGGSAERKFHRQFAGFRLKRGEWFRPAPSLLKLVADLKEIRDLVQRFEEMTATGRAPRKAVRRKP